MSDVGCQEFVDRCPLIVFLKRIRFAKLEPCLVREGSFVKLLDRMLDGRWQMADGGWRNSLSVDRCSSVGLVYNNLKLFGYFCGLFLNDKERYNYHWRWAYRLSMWH